mgnify:CR=1 FL=1
MEWIGRLGRVWVEGQVTQVSRRPGTVAGHDGDFCVAHLPLAVDLLSDIVMRPVSNPDDNGSRARMPTPRRARCRGCTACSSAAAAR